MKDHFSATRGSAGHFRAACATRLLLLALPATMLAQFNYTTNSGTMNVKHCLSRLFLLSTLIVGLGLMLAGQVMAQTFTTLHNFTDGNDGGQPVADLILSGNTLYGTAEYGGSSHNGTVFRVNTDGTGFTNLHSFTATSGPLPSTNSDGANPHGRLIFSGSTLYGTTYWGGSSGYGTVFAVNTDGTGFTNLHSFITDDGASPYAGLILLGNTLYGTTVGGGSWGRGTVFAINTDGTGFTNLYNFTAFSPSPPYTNSDGFYPYGRLLLSGNTLYGTTYGGGSAGNGTVFRVNTDGTGFTSLYSFRAGSGSLNYVVNSDGAGPFAGLVLAGNTLYGTADTGGSSGYGTVFAVNTDGTGFTNLYSFTAISGDYINSDGAGPRANLILSGNTLYGTAMVGGGSGNGTVFAINTDGTGFTNLYGFTATAGPVYTNSDGTRPSAGLILSGSTLYGTAGSGGSSGWGTVFSLILVPQGLAYTTNNGTITITGYTGSGGTVSIPDTINGLLVTSIGNWAFNSCYSLTRVTIPNSVTNIGNYTFSRCTNLTSVTIPNSVTRIMDSAFYSCSSLTSVTIPNMVTSIMRYAFASCTSLTNVTISNSVTTIGEGAFYECSSLTSVTIPNTVTNIGEYVFQGCASLTSITIPDSVTSISGYMFRFCSSLTNVTIPNSVTDIGGDAFLGCSSLTHVTIPNSVTSIGMTAFLDCTSLTDVTIGANVTRIWDYAFTRCTKLAAVYFLGNAPAADSAVFNYANKATVYYLPGTTNWGTTFGGRPTKLWQPQLQTSDASFGVRTNQFGFNITWASGRVVVVEACANLTNPIWVPLQTNTLSDDPCYFSDPHWTNYPRGFYRLRWP